MLGFFSFLLSRVSSNRSELGIVHNCTVNKVRRISSFSTNALD